MASAVYGSVIYNRFDPRILANLPQQPSAEDIHRVVVSSDIWSQKITLFDLPSPLNIMMGDVCGGSSSVSMAKAVLDWKKHGEDQAKEIWASLADCNGSICDEFIRLRGFSTQKPSEFQTAVQLVSSLDSSRWNSDDEIQLCLLEIRTLFKKARRLLKLMGEQAGVGIEPDSQTDLADATDSIPGVLCAGVPGAGGVDAIFCIVMSEKSRRDVESMWSTWEATTVCPLLLSADFGVGSGVRIENGLY